MDVKNPERIFLNSLKALIAGKLAFDLKTNRGQSARGRKRERLGAYMKEK